MTCTILQNLLKTPFNIIEMLSLFLFYVLFFLKDAHWNTKRMLPPFAFFLCLSIWGSLYGSNLCINIAVLVLLLSADFLLTKHRLYNLIMFLPAFFFYTLCAVFPEYMIRQTLGEGYRLILDVDQFNIVSMLIDFFLFILLCCTAWNCQKLRLSLRLTAGEIGIFCLYFFFVLFEIFILTVFEGNLTNNARILSGSILFLFSVILFIVYWSYLFLRRQKQQLEGQIRETENYLSIQLQFAEQNLENQTELRQLRHDLRNHLQVIQELCARGNYIEAEKYAAGLSERPELSRQLQLTGNQIADIVISAKRETALSLDIAFSCEGSFQCLDDLEATDVCTLLSNLLDNALEASVQTEHGEIDIQGIPHMNFFTVVIKNRVKERIVVKNNCVSTTKKDRHNHGMGLMAVKQVAEKYGGEYVISCDEQFFTVKVIFPMK